MAVRLTAAHAAKLEFNALRQNGPDVRSKRFTLRFRSPFKEVKR